MSLRPHASCELCRAGVALTEGNHRDTIAGGVHRFRRCSAKCAQCSKPIKPGELFREIPVPSGTEGSPRKAEVHEACLA